jgi:hypothetical protein
MLYLQHCHGLQEMAHFVGLILKSSKICLRNGELYNKEYVRIRFEIKTKSSAILEGVLAQNKD